MAKQPGVSCLFLLVLKSLALFRHILFCQFARCGGQEEASDDDAALSERIGRLELAIELDLARVAATDLAIAEAAARRRACQPGTQQRALEQFLAHMRARLNLIK